MTTYKQLWIRENPKKNFNEDAGCRDHELVHLGVVQRNCFNKRCSDCWNEEIKITGSSAGTDTTSSDKK